MPCDESIQAVSADNIELNDIDITAGSNSSFFSQIPTTSKDNSISIKIPNNADIFDTSKKPSKKRSHSDNCLVICIVCLEKCKEKRPRKLSGHKSVTDSLAVLYPEFYEHEKYLPGIICQCCFDKIEKQTECTVNYKALSESVMISKCFSSESSETAKNVCEMCILGSASINPKKSQFLLKSKPNPGKTSLNTAIKSQPKITAFFPFARSKKLGEKEKLEKILDTVETSSVQQLITVYLDREFKKNESVSLKRPHGPPQKLKKDIKKGNQKSIISHETMIKIKKEINSSNNKTIKLSQMLTTECEVKLEPYFKQALIDMPKKVIEYFDYETVEMDIYDLVDSQYWRWSNEDKLIAKVGEIHCEEKNVILPDVGKPGLIEDVNSGQVLTVKNSAGDVIMKDKIKITIKATRSSKKVITLRASKAGTPHPTRPALKSEFSDSQSWVCGPANSQGWFRIQHVKTGKYLTSSDSTSMIIDDLIDPTENPKKRVPIKVKKDIGYTHTEAFLTHVVDARNYADDSELKVEIGLDGGKGSLKMCMAVEAIKLGEGEFGPVPGPPPAKKKKTGTWHSRHKDRGVKKIFVTCCVREVAETYHNFSVLLKLSGLSYFGFVMDFKANRICLGQQNCAATFPCPYCLGKKPFLGKPTLRTFQMLLDDANGYKALVADIGEENARKLAYKYHSQVELSLIKGDFPAQLVLFKVLLDELHIFLGVGNQIFDGLHKALVEDIDYQFHETCYKWAYDNSLVGLKYRGGQMGQLISE